jgi:6-phosphogluconolactonase
MFVYVGAYTEPPQGKAEGIAVFRFDAQSGALSPVQVVTGIANPSFLALDARQRYLYAVNELDEGGVTAFARDVDDGTLLALNRQLSHGADPCYVSLVASGRYALVANYSGGSVAVLPITADGRLKPATSVVQHELAGSDVRSSRHVQPHPHMVAPATGGRHILVTDLGLDRVFVYQLDAITGQLAPNERGPGWVNTNPGSGPRHFAFGADGRCLYVINELDSTLTLFTYDEETGEMRPEQTVSTLPDDFAGENTCAHIVATPDGRFVYGSNRGHDTIAIWRIAGERGEVELVGHEPTRGKEPRNFSLDPSGDWLLVANQDSDTIMTFRRDRDAGTLTAAGPPTATPSPVAIAFSHPMEV